MKSEVWGSGGGTGFLTSLGPCQAVTSPGTLPEPETPVLGTTGAPPIPLLPALTDSFPGLRALLRRRLGAWSPHTPAAGCRAQSRAGAPDCLGLAGSGRVRRGCPPGSHVLRPAQLRERGHLRVLGPEEGRAPGARAGGAGAGGNPLLLVTSQLRGERRRRRGGVG